MGGAIRLSQRRKAETRQGLLDAAYKVFAQRGYAQATIDDIAAACGVSKGAVYHHFASKEELFRAILEERGKGHLTTIDLAATTHTRSPTIFELLRKLNLEHRVTPVLAHRSYTWEL